MPNRRVAETMELDLSLRTARSWYVVASILSVPGAILTLPWIFEGVPQIVAHLVERPIENIGLVVWNVFLSVGAILFAFLMVSQSIEAGRRIRLLAENPNASVKPMFVPTFLKHP